MQGIGASATTAIAIGLALGCGGAGLREEAELGRQKVAEVRRRYEVVVDPAVADYVRNVGAELLRAAGPQPYRYRFYVLEDESPYGFSIAGGHVFVYTGTLRAARHSSDVAAILAHEIAHVVLRHQIEQIDRSRVAERRAAVKQATSVKQNVVGDGPNGPRGAQFMQRAYSQQDELEADRFAVGLLDAAGYCAGALSDLFAVWAAEAEPTDVYFQLFAATHPVLEYRILELAPDVERRGACEAPAAGAPDPLEAVQARLGEGE